MKQVCSHIQNTPMRWYILTQMLIAIGGALLLVYPACGQMPKETKRVLILLTGQLGVPGYELAKEGMLASLEQSNDFRFEYFIEYMDRYRFKDKSYQNDLLSLYRTKYSNKEIDLIIAYGYHALDFAATHGDNIFPHTPVVFSAVLEKQLERLNPDRIFTGSLLKIDYVGLLNTALKNHPDAVNVAVITGASKVSRLIEDRARKAYAPYVEKYEFTYLGHLPMSDLLGRLATLPNHSVVIYYYLTLDGAGKEFKPWEVASMISEASNAPVYGFADTYLGHGIVGGSLLSYAAHGRKAGEIGLRILNGENPSDVPSSSEGTILNMFDWRQLKRWGIPESNLPEGSIIRYKELSVWLLYKWYTIGGISITLVQGIFLILLTFQRKMIRHREQRLRESDAKLRAFIENTDDMICGRDREGACIFWNDSFNKACKNAFGTEASVGLKTGDLVPPEQRKN